jgi:hypothetical protein
MGSSGLRVLADGITSVASHNNVHRVVCYQLNAKGEAEPSVEILIPSASVKAFAAALSRLK